MCNLPMAGGTYSMWMCEWALTCMFGCAVYGKQIIVIDYYHAV